MVAMGQSSDFAPQVQLWQISLWSTRFCIRWTRIYWQVQRRRLKMILQAVRVSKF